MYIVSTILVEIY